VVDRYCGQIAIKNRIENDFRQGTITEILLKQAEDPAEENSKIQ